MANADDELNKRLTDVCNQSVKAALRVIVKPTIAAGGNHAAVMTVLEGVVTGVLLTLYTDPKKASFMFDEGIVPRVIERLAKYEANNGK